MVELTAIIKVLTVAFLISAPAHAREVRCSDYVPTMPQAPEVPRGTPMSNSYLFALANDDTPQVRDDVVFHVLLHDILGVCTDGDAEKNHTFSCEQWAAGETDLVITVDEKSEDMKVELVSEMPAELCALYESSPRYERGPRKGVPVRYENFGPIGNPLHFSLKARPAYTKPGQYYTFGSYPFPELPRVGNTASFNIVFAPVPDSWPEVASFAVKFQNTKYAPKASVVQATATATAVSAKAESCAKAKNRLECLSHRPLTVQGQAYRCATLRCGLGY